MRAKPYHRGLAPGILEKTMKGWVGEEEKLEDGIERVDVVVATSECRT